MDRAAVPCSESREHTLRQVCSTHPHPCLPGGNTWARKLVLTSRSPLMRPNHRKMQHPSLPPERRRMQECGKPRRTMTSTTQVIVEASPSALIYDLAENKPPSSKPLDDLLTDLPLELSKLHQQALQAVQRVHHALATPELVVVYIDYAGICAHAWSQNAAFVMPRACHAVVLSVGFTCETGHLGRTAHSEKPPFAVTKSCLRWCHEYSTPIGWIKGCLSFYSLTPCLAVDPRSFGVAWHREWLTCDSLNTKKCG